MSLRSRGALRYSPSDTCRWLAVGAMGGVQTHLGRSTRSCCRSGRRRCRHHSRRAVCDRQACAMAMRCAGHTHAHVSASANASASASASASAKVRSMQGQVHVNMCISVRDAHAANGQVPHAIPEPRARSLCICVLGYLPVHLCHRVPRSGRGACGSRGGHGPGVLCGVHRCMEAQIKDAEKRLPNMTQSLPPP